MTRINKTNHGADMDFKKKNTGHGIKTLELARIYESQGHYQEALDMYAYLDTRQSSREITAGLNRMKAQINTPTKSLPNVSFDRINEAPGHRVEALVTAWLDMIVLEDRLNRLNRINPKAM